MATVGFAALGSYAASGYGAVAAAAIQAGFTAVGSIIDSQYVFPWLFPADDIKGQKIDDFGVMRSAEGSPVPWGRGTARVEGTVVYAHDVTALQETQKVGGKGGPDVTNYRYQRTLVVAFTGETHESSATLEQLFADGEPIYDTTTTTNKFGNDILADTGQVGLTSAAVTYALYITAPSGGTDLSVFNENYAIKVDGFTDPDNNVDEVPFDVRTNPTGSTTVEFRRTLSVSSGQPPPPNPWSAESAGATISLTQTPPALKAGVADIFRTYPGANGTLTVDPTLESQKGAGNVSAFAGRLTAMLGGFNLTKYGNRVPQFVGVFGNSPSGADQILAAAFERSGVPPGRQSVGFSAGSFFARGLVSRGPQSARSTLSQLLLTGSGIVRERDGRIEVIDAPETVEASLTDDDIVFPLTSTQKPGFAWTPIGELRRPVHLSLTYQDVDRDNEVRAVRETSQDGTDRTEEVAVDLSNIALTREEARTIAFRIMHANDQAQPVAGTLAPNKWWVAGGDLLSVRRGSQDVKVQVVNRLRNVSGSVEIEGIETDAAVWDFVIPPDPDPPSA